MITFVLCSLVLLLSTTLSRAGPPRFISIEDPSLVWIPALGEGSGGFSSACNQIHWTDDINGTVSLTFSVQEALATLTIRFMQAEMGAIGQIIVDNKVVATLDTALAGAARTSCIPQEFTIGQLAVGQHIVTLKKLAPSPTGIPAVDKTSLIMHGFVIAEGPQLSSSIAPPTSTASSVAPVQSTSASFVPPTSSASTTSASLSSVPASTPAPSTSAQISQNTSKSAVIPIVGGVLGGVAALGLVVVLLIVIWRRTQPRQAIDLTDGASFDDYRSSTSQSILSAKYNSPLVPQAPAARPPMATQTPPAMPLGSALPERSATAHLANHLTPQQVEWLRRLAAEGVPPQQIHAVFAGMLRDMPVSQSTVEDRTLAGAGFTTGHGSQV